MNLITGLFRATKRKLSLTNDNDMGAFRDSLNDIVANKDKLSDEEIIAKVDDLKKLCDDLPESEDKSSLLRFLEDFKSVKEQDAEVAKQAGEEVSKLFERLDAEAMKDTPVVEPEKVEETTKEDVVVVEEDKTEDDGEEVKKDDYALEEIYQFVKKRLAEDGECTTDAENEDDKKDTIVGDSAPSIPVTVNNNANNGGLEALFASIKRS